MKKLIIPLLLLCGSSSAQVTYVSDPNDIRLFKYKDSIRIANDWVDIRNKALSMLPNIKTAADFGRMLWECNLSIDECNPGPGKYFLVRKYFRDKKEVNKDECICHSWIDKLFPVYVETSFEIWTPGPYYPKVKVEYKHECVAKVETTKPVKAKVKTKVSAEPENKIVAVKTEPIKKGILYEWYTNSKFDSSKYYNPR